MCHARIKVCPQDDVSVVDFLLPSLTISILSSSCRNAFSVSLCFFLAAALLTAW
eukprot:m.27610 g.27610  ORF g.27610 m.27610 type:complete len:54 (-) comp13981_c0_seq1:1465-1626(-)